MTKINSIYLSHITRKQVFKFDGRGFEFQHEQQTFYIKDTWNCAKFCSIDFTTDPSKEEVSNLISKTVSTIYGQVGRDVTL